MSCILEMLPVAYWALGLDKMEFQWHLMVSMDAVWAVTSPL